MNTLFKRAFKTLAICSVFGTSFAMANDNATGGDNALLYSVAWKQTAAEYQALYYQGFNIAKMHVQEALANHKKGDKPIAIVSDFDDTLVQHVGYWGNLVNKNKDFFDDSIWDKWIPTNGLVASPGAKDFLEYCEKNGVEIFYISSREQGEKTFEYALDNIHHLGFPLKDESHFTVLRDTSNKETRQDQIMEKYDVAVFLGDSLNDFRRKYYIKGDVDARMDKMKEDRDKYGMKYVLFPNPTDGQWLAAIFGESEPAANDQNRMILKKAAAKSAWNNK
ncbi:acid phosphatase [Vibrio sp. UCD-FRSSP16_10]|uniref:5'-nucleotidase, lipoprotein e(P4) family n=1 Tax=unclassified Vibrio TaxID=2614977 RepID=UPI0007FC719E|nr:MULTISPECIES: HAD family acid phosphatase [unclassified Vibrio]OBT12066.1 acid phosphatase [Vibrio sp. UCD-FRSSP16_30]OBT20397.1 acid phosphatase [Vibrio sp. UCD-FRSSP16_10]